MAPIHPDSRRRALLGLLLATVALPCPWPASAADKREPIEWRAKGGLEGNPTGLTLKGPEVRQGSTFLRAAKADAAGLDNGGGADNSTWKFAGDVHLEFDGAVLDAQAATVVFANGRLQSAQVQPAPSSTPQPAQGPVHLEFKGAVLDSETASVAFADGRMRSVQTLGSPARFSHQFKGSAQRVNGRANRLDYDAVKNQIRFTIDANFSKGGLTFQTQEGFYNLGDGLFGAVDSSSGTAPLRSEERVPSPRTPDRPSAK